MSKKQAADIPEVKVEIPKKFLEIAEKFDWEPESTERRVKLLEKDGITVENLLEWKNLYGEVYRDSFVGKAFYYRTITRAEYINDVMEIEDFHKREERVAEICTLYPIEYDFANGLGGVASRLMELILDKSGFLTDGPSMAF